MKGQWRNFAAGSKMLRATQILLSSHRDALNVPSFCWLYSVYWSHPSTIWVAYGNWMSKSTIFPDAKKTLLKEPSRKIILNFLGLCNMLEYHAIINKSYREVKAHWLDYKPETNEFKGSIWHKGRGKNVFW